MTFAATLLIAAIATPPAILVILVALPLRRRMHILLPLAPIPAMAAAIFARGAAVSLPPSLLRMTMVLDDPGAILLGVAALLWTAAGAAAAVQRDTATRPFMAWWLLTLTGSLGVFVAADLVSFYFLFALVSLPAYWLVAADGTAEARRAGAVYVAFAIFGEALLLLAFVLLSAGEPGGSIRIADVVAALPASPWRDAALALLIAGFGVKIALLPLHVWMPLSYSAAPFPAAAALSGAAVKAGVIGLIRFLPLATALPEWGTALAALGLCGAFYGVAVGLTQPNPKTVLAYSSISQMGLIAASFGTMQAGQATSGAALLGLCIYAAHHVLAKGGLFLALGAASSHRRRWHVMLPAAVVALGIAGFPLTGGAVSKLALKPALGDGTVAFLAALSAAGSTLLMIHFLRRFAASPAGDAGDARNPLATGMWWGIAAAAVIIPWAQATDARIPLSGMFALKSLWPVALGLILAAALWRIRLPAIPPGDIVAAAPALARAADAVSNAAERIDAALRRWPVAGLSLLTIAAALFALLARG